jgi:hypothetical protein
VLKLDGAPDYQVGQPIPDKRTWTVTQDVVVNETLELRSVKLQHVTKWVWESLPGEHTTDWYLYHEDFFPRGTTTVARKQ